MIIYKEASVTKREDTSVDTLSYYGYTTDSTITSDDLVKNGLNHIYKADSGFYKILFVVNGTAYVSAPTKYSSGTLVLKLGEKDAQKISIAETLSLVDVK